MGAVPLEISVHVNGMHDRLRDNSDREYERLNEEDDVKNGLIIAAISKRIYR